MWAMKADLPDFKSFILKALGESVHELLAPALQLASATADESRRHEITLFELFWSFPGTPYELVCE